MRIENFIDRFIGREKPDKTQLDNALKKIETFCKRAGLNESQTESYLGRVKESHQQLSPEAFQAEMDKLPSSIERATRSNQTPTEELPGIIG